MLLLTMLFAVSPQMTIQSDSRDTRPITDAGLNRRFLVAILVAILTHS